MCLCFLQFGCVRIPYRDCFTDCGKLNYASLQLVAIYSCGSFLRHLHSTALDLLQNFANGVSIYVNLKHFIDFLLDATLLRLSKKSPAILFFVCLPICAHPMWCYIMNFSTSCGSLLMFLYSFFTKTLTFYLIGIFL